METRPWLAHSCGSTRESRPVPPIILPHILARSVAFLSLCVTHGTSQQFSKINTRPRLPGARSILIGQPEANVSSSRSNTRFKQTFESSILFAHSARNSGLLVAHCGRGPLVRARPAGRIVPNVLIDKTSGNRRGPIARAGQPKNLATKHSATPLLSGGTRESRLNVDRPN